MKLSEGEQGNKIYGMLAERSGLVSLPKLEELSRLARQQFTEEYGDVLFLFWSEAFRMAIAGGRIPWTRVRKAVPKEACDTEKAAGRTIAERLIDQLGERSEVDDAPSWGNLEKWLSWLVGKPAYAAGRRIVYERRGDDEERDEEKNGRPHERVPDEHKLQVEVEGRQELERVLEFIDLSSSINETVVSRTRVPELELYWLWSTCVARRPISRLLKGAGAEGMVFDDLYGQSDKQPLVEALPVDGKTNYERKKRAWAGAGACLRFNLEFFFREDDTLAEWERGRAVILGPTKGEPYYKPKDEVTDDVYSVVEDVMRLSVRVRRSVANDHAPLAEVVRADTLGCAVKKGAGSLLPKRHRSALGDYLDELTQSLGEKERT